MFTFHVLLRKLLHDVAIYDFIDKPFVAVAKLFYHVHDS